MEIYSLLSHKKSLKSPEYKEAIKANFNKYKDLNITDVKLIGGPPCTDLGPGA